MVLVLKTERERRHDDAFENPDSLVIGPSRVRVQDGEYVPVVHMLDKQTAEVYVRELTRNSYSPFDMAPLGSSRSVGGIIDAKVTERLQARRFGLNERIGHGQELRTKFAVLRATEIMVEQCRKHAQKIGATHFSLEDEIFTSQRYFSSDYDSIVCGIARNPNADALTEHVLRFTGTFQGYAVRDAEQLRLFDD